MIIIEDAKMSGVNPFYPLLTRKGQPIRLVSWERYNRNLLPFALIGVVLCGYGLAMLSPEFYSDLRFEIFGFANLCFAFSRSLRMRKARTIYIAQAISIRKTSLLADLEFATSFAAFGLGAAVVATSGDSDYAGPAAVLALVSFLFAPITVFNTVAFSIGIGKAR